MGGKPADGVTPDHNAFVSKELLLQKQVAITTQPPTRTDHPMARYARRTAVFHDGANRPPGSRSAGESSDISVGRYPSRWNQSDDREDACGECTTRGRVRGGHQSIHPESAGSRAELWTGDHVRPVAVVEERGLTVTQVE